MVYFDERSNTHGELGKALMLSIQELVQKACHSLNVFQGLLVEIDDENVNVLVKASAGHSPSFKSVPVFCADPSSDSRFPINSNVCPMGFKHWFSMYFNADRYIRGKFHYVDSRQFCLIFINACPSQTINHEKIALVDEWLSVTVEKYLIEKAEARQKSLYKKLQHVANIGTWEVDTVSNCVSWSSQAKAIHEVTNDYVPTLESAFDFYQEPYRGEVRKLVFDAIKTGAPWSATVQLTSAKSNLIWIETHGTAEFKDGKCIRLFGTIQNVDKAVHARIELENKRAEAINASTESAMLLSRISHELKTPLNGITGMLQALKCEQRDLVRKKKTDLAIHSAERLHALVDDVLDYTSIKNGELKLNPQNFCVAELFNEIVDRYKAKCAERGIRFHALLAVDEKSLVYGDPIRIEQIVTNLLSNALKFTHSGYVAIQVTLKYLEGLPVLITSVEDSGVGMDNTILSRIFKPFENKTQHASEELNGSGLGLSIVGQLVNEMNGEIDVRSEVGMGTSFDVVIQLETAHRSKEDIVLPKTPFNSNLNILIVDDNDINRLVIASMLEKYDIVPDEAHNGEVAVEKARSKQYDVIFMDCMMPVLDGASATKIILQEGLMTKHGFVVAVTANTSPKDKVMCSQAGMADFLTKPVLPYDVALQIKRALSGKSMLM